MRIRQNLVEISKEIRKMLKTNKAYEIKHKKIIKQWCKHTKLIDEIKNVWKFFTFIQKIESETAKEK